MKVKDKLYCHTELSSKNGVMLSKGHIYTVITIISDLGFIIIDNNLDRHQFTFNCYYNWFIELQKLRKQKLQKLNNVQA